MRKAAGRRLWRRRSHAPGAFFRGGETLAPFFAGEATAPERTEGAEREAEEVAKHVLGDSAGAPRIAESPAAPSGARATTRAMAAVRTGGRPLESSEKRYFEPRFGRDLSDVRLHDDAEAGAAAREIGARAYTHGPHIAFAPGRHSPETAAGRRLLAHELTHAVQQRRAGRAGVQRQPEADVAETRVATPAGLPPGRTWHVVIVGAPGPGEVAAGHADQFIRAAEQHPFAELGSPLRTVWLVERTGYARAGISEDRIRARGPQHVFFIDEETSLVALLNSFPRGSIGRLDAYSHGVPGMMALRYGWSGAGNYGLTTAQARSLSPEAFAQDARLSFDSCNSGTDEDGTSLAQQVADSTQRITEGWTGRTSYRVVNAERFPGDRRVVASEILRGFDTTELWSQLRGRHPDEVEFRARSAPGSFQSTFSIKARLPESRHFPVPAGAGVRLTIAPGSEYRGVVEGLSFHVILWRTIDWGSDDDNGGSRTIVIGPESTLTWTGLAAGDYYVELYHLHGVPVSGPISVEIQPGGGDAR